jgi:hypothetical protein
MRPGRRSHRHAQQAQPELVSSGDVLSADLFRLAVWCALSQVSPVLEVCTFGCTRLCTSSCTPTPRTEDRRPSEGTSAYWGALSPQSAIRYSNISRTCPTSVEVALQIRSSGTGCPAPTHVIVTTWACVGGYS